jgi:hypothetical protein
MGLWTPYAKLDLGSTLSKRFTTSATATTPIQVPTWTSGSATPNPWNTTANQPGGPRDLGARGIWLISVLGSAVNILNATTSTLATAAAPYFSIGWCPLPVAFPPGTWISILGTATAGTVDFIHVDFARE